MFHNCTFKVLSNLILLAFFCTGQVAAAPNSSANEMKRNSSANFVNAGLPLAPEFAQRNLSRHYSHSGQQELMTVGPTNLISGNINAQSLVETKIAFVAFPSGNPEIYIVNANGSGETNLTNDPGWDFSPVWSPDGTKIAFESYRDGDYDIYIMNADGSGQTPLTNNSSTDNDPAWSSDGSKIAFASNRDGNGGIYIMNPDGTGQIRLNNSSDAIDPTWSPDGTRIAFSTSRDGNSEIYSMNINGTSLANLSNNSAPDYLPEWSPNGTSIVFVSERDGNREIYSMLSNGSQQNNLTHTSAGEYTPSWSSDATKIVFTSFSLSPAPLFVMNADGTNKIQLTFPSTNNYEPAWSRFPIVPPTGKPVVVLVHGWMGLGRQVSCSEGITLYDDNQNFDGENGDAIGDIPDWLNSQGFEVWSAHLTTGPDYTASLRGNALCLRDQIAQVRSRVPNGKVIVIAHSMGGLVSRAYIEDNGLYQNDVKTLITLGSPHQGVPVPWWDTVKRLIGFFKGWTCDNQVAVCEFTEGIDQFNQQHSIRRTSVEYYTVSGDLRFSDSTWMSRLLSAAIPGADDGGVPQTSGNGLSGSHQTLATSEAHIKDFGLFSYFGPPPGDLYSFSYADCIQPVLAGNPDGCHAFASQAPVETATLSFSALSPIVEGSLSSGQLVAHTIGIDGSGSALFAASWTGGTVTFTLESPSGQIIDPAYASAHPDEVSYLQSAADDTPLGASYAITTAEAGVWTMNLQAGSVPEGSAYALLVAMESPITLTVQTDRDWYTPGATATITATLGGSPLSTMVTAEILRADGVTDTLSFSSIGNGQYQAFYTVPDARGYAEVHLVATGTTASSVPFERGTSLAFQISPDTFILNNAYTDTPIPYPGLSRYQFLNVTVGINATVGGKVGLSADLVDGSGNFVAHALTIQDVTAGTVSLTLQFAGADIFASQHNGPYTLTNVLVTDENGATLVTQQAQAVYTTAPYLYTDFAMNFQIYLPLIMR